MALSSSQATGMTCPIFMCLISYSEYVGYNKTYRAVGELADSKVFANVPLILVNPSPDLQTSAIFGHEAGSKFIFTGDEYLEIKDAGSTNPVYCDAIAFYGATYVLNNATIQRVSQ
jgi:hypothetical protein